MDDKKSWGSTVLGWFVVRDPAAEDSSAAEAGADSTPPTPPTDEPAFFEKEPPPAPGGAVDFDGVFDAAGIKPEERQLVEKTRALLSGLPADTPAPVKKQIVEASLTAFGVPIEKIIETGASEIQALEGYIRTGAADTRKLLEESNARIKQFEDEIARIRLVMEQRTREQQTVTDACNGQKVRIQQILEFFGQDAVARVVQASPKLHGGSV